jgi:hypothetical protein
MIEMIFKLLAIAAPYAIQAGVDIADAVKRINAGEKVEDLIDEAKAKRDDLQDLPFK